MSGDHLKKVQSGDPLRIPAATFNAMIDAAVDYCRRTAHIGQKAATANGSEQDHGAVNGITNGSGDPINGQCRKALERGG